MHLIEQPKQFPDSGFGGQSLRPDVGYAVTRLISQAGSGLAGQVRTQTVGRGQTRPFANQYDEQSRPERIANRVADGNPPLLHDADRSQ